ncbi:PDZ domain-containing protein [Brumimicrobium glaciale]|jgi:Do/DeqQ family serine protease|uniref:PDZ domain-containing protein n=1 Tax=Brumimicrobium glaciale TaxID=200475 RepID=A0A4Q4KE08_9FLAO|nr:trypsin-like peptidase domain-containing protein [Brumimicrobium glaciale]RYM30810.1 PDZ domain-containing protein [Brumimicrobium glaciale]
MKKNMKSIGLGILGGLLPLGVFFMLDSSDYTSSTGSTSGLIEETGAPVANINFASSEIDSKLDFTKASEESIHSVVHVKTKVVQSYVQTDPFLEFFYGPGAGRERKQFGSGSGSGVIVSQDGYIVTNNHVIQNASEIQVTLNNNTTFDAVVVGTDPSTDIAVLKIEKTGLRAMPIANSDDVKVGQWVLAVGNPFNLNSTVTAGIVSAKARNINIIGSQNKEIMPIESFIQTDAAVNPGNSGGALINTQGQLIGINTAIASQTGNYAGYSFAVPSRLVAKIMSDLIDYGMVQRGFLGIQILEVTQDLINEKKLVDSKGLYIAGVNADSGAEKAKVKEGDVILKVGSKSINSVAELQEEIGRRRPGDIVTLTLRREGDVITKDVLLKNIDGNTDLTSKDELEKYSALGATFTELTKTEKKELNISNGVKISSISSGKLRSIGLSKGIIITKFNNVEVTSVEQLTEYLKRNDQKGVLLEIMTESGRKDYVGFGL